MKAILIVSRSGQWPASLLLFASLCLAALAYQAGLGGSLHFDDPYSLGGLTQVIDTPSTLQFIAEGRAGVLGRPLALASFTPQAYAWPHSPDVFLYTNICLHLLNGTLVTWMLYLLLITSSRECRQTAWIASVSGAIWMLLPILASSSLLIVQRMTTLSATFVLLGIIGYFYSRTMLEQRPRLALLLMSVSTVVGTGLATLTKENGALLPLFILVAEATFLRRPSRDHVRVWWKAWCAVFLVVPAIGLLAYLALQLPYEEATRLVRDFSGAERLLTQAHILWQYLYRAFVPIASGFGPFHDDRQTYTDWFQPLSILAVAGWIVVSAIAVRFRRRAPLFAFAAGWYLVGHALESTTIPLELYFEHRNYIPLIGPVFGLVAITLDAAPRWRTTIRSGLLAYALLLALVLFNTTSVWGRPTLAGEIWAIHHPDSKRASQYLAQQHQQAGDDPAASRVLRHYLKAHPGSADVALQILALSCVLEPKEAYQELEIIKANLSSANFEHGTFEAIQRLYRMAKDEQCDPVDRRTVYDLAAMTAANPKFQAVPVALHNLHVLMSEEAFAQRNLDLTMHHIEAALSVHYPMTTLMFAVQTLNSAGLYSAAEDFVRQAHAHEPRHPLQAAVWRQQIAGLEKTMNGVRHD